MNLNYLKNKRGKKEGSRSHNQYGGKIGLVSSG